MAEESLGGRQLMRALLAAFLFLSFAAATALAAPKDKRPEWASLTADQQQVLAPLAGEWDRHLTKEQRVKWLGIATRYPKMTSQGQKRVLTRMQKWAKLTPQQRDQAREQYRNIAKVAPDRRIELRKYWADYQALPPHERRMFDVPPSYLPPAERRQRASPAKPKPYPKYAVPDAL